MLNTLILALAFVSPSAAQTADFSELQAFDAAAVRAADIAVPAADKSWGVNYNLKGLLSDSPEGAFLNTPDGRLFRLELSARDARRFDGHSVSIEAQARQSDDLSLLKVKKISLYEPKAGEVTPAPYQPRRRQALMLADAAGEIRMGNVRTMHSAVPPVDSFDWTTMTMRPELVKNVYFVKKPFPPEFLAAHSFLVFTFEKGALKDGEGREPMALALSVEARTRTDQTFSPLTGLKKSFGIIWSLSTWEEYAARTVHHEKFRLFPYPVRLSHSEKAALLREAMAQAAVDREGEFYHTIKNNCTNNLIILFNRVLPKERQIKLWTIPYLVYNPKATMPQMVIGKLQKEGILGQEFAEINQSTLDTVLP